MCCPLKEAVYGVETNDHHETVALGRPSKETGFDLETKSDKEKTVLGYPCYERDHRVRTMTGEAIMNADGRQTDDKIEPIVN